MQSVLERVSMLSASTIHIINVKYDLRRRQFWLPQPYVWNHLKSIFLVLVKLNSLNYSIAVSTINSKSLNSTSSTSMVKSFHVETFLLHNIRIFPKFVIFLIKFLIFSRESFTDLCILAIRSISFAILFF